jgi:hypothetical protein
MTQQRRVKLSAMQRTDLWSRWKAGQSLHQIGRAFGKSHVSIHFLLSQWIDGIISFPICPNPGRAAAWNFYLDLQNGYCAAVTMQGAWGIARFSGGLVSRLTSVDF